MCEANAYLIKNENYENCELIMEAVDTVEPSDNGLKIANIFGEQKFLDAYIHSLSLVEHKIFLKQN